MYAHTHTQSHNHTHTHKELGIWKMLVNLLFGKGGVAYLRSLGRGSLGRALSPETLIPSQRSFAEHIP